MHKKSSSKRRKVNHGVILSIHLRKESINLTFLTNSILTNRLSSCQTAAVEKRYTWHHNSVLYTITNYMSTIGQNNSKVYVDDIEGFPSPEH